MRRAGDAVRHRRNAAAIVAVLAVALIALAPAVAWLALALPGEADLGPDPDYLIRPIGLRAPLRHAIGATAAGVVLFGAAVWAFAVRKGYLVPGSARVLGPPAVVSGYVGLSYRVVTAPVSGANIGGGFLILFGMALVPLLVGVAVVNARELHHS